MAALDDPKVLDEEFVKDFLSQLPVNVAKVRQWIKHDNLRDKFPHSFKEVQEWNKSEPRKGKKKKRSAKLGLYKNRHQTKNTSRREFSLGSFLFCLFPFMAYKLSNL